MGEGALLESGIDGTDGSEGREEIAVPTVGGGATRAELIGRLGIVGADRGEGGSELTVGGHGGRQVGSLALSYHGTAGAHGGELATSAGIHAGHVEAEISGQREVGANTAGHVASVVGRVLANVVNSATGHVVHHVAEIDDDTSRGREGVVGACFVLRSHNAVHISARRGHQGNKGHQDKENYYRKELEARKMQIKGQKQGIKVNRHPGPFPIRTSSLAMHPELVVRIYLSTTSQLRRKATGVTPANDR